LTGIRLKAKDRWSTSAQTSQPKALAACKTAPGINAGVVDIVLSLFLAGGGEHHPRQG